MSQLNYPAIRRQISIRRVLELLHYQPTLQRGPQWRGPCPICCDDSLNEPCFSVHVGRDLFRCFRCQRSGNQLDLWAYLSGRSIYPATLQLCRHLNIEPIPLRNPQPPNRH